MYPERRDQKHQHARRRDRIEGDAIKHWSHRQDQQHRERAGRNRPELEWRQHGREQHKARGKHQKRKIVRSTWLRYSIRSWEGW